MWIANTLAGCVMVGCYYIFGPSLGWKFKMAYVLLGLANFYFAYLNFVK